MKWTTSILLIVLAASFMLKDVIPFISDKSEQICYAIDCDTEKVPDGDGEDTKDEKDVKEECKIFSQAQLNFINNITSTAFHLLDEKAHFTPYFEIISPPPEVLV